MAGNDVKLGDLHLRFPYFEDQIEPRGHLTPDRACHAAWYYFMCAYANFLQVGSGPESQVIIVDEGLETPLWMEQRYHQIAKTTALLYGLDSPDDFLKFVNVVDAEARRMAYAGNHEFDMPAALWKPFGIGESKQ